MVDREGPKEEEIHEVEDHRAESDAEGQGQGGGGEERRSLAKAPERVSQISSHEQALPAMERKTYQPGSAKSSATGLR
jgi:hypothetical protein